MIRRVPNLEPRSASPAGLCWDGQASHTCLYLPRILLLVVSLTLLEPYEEQLQQAESMPGWGRRSAQDAVAETGVDMTRFRTGGHLACWAGRTPLRARQHPAEGLPQAAVHPRHAL